MGLDRIRSDYIKIRLDAGQRDTTGQKVKRSKVKGQKGQTNTQTNTHTPEIYIYR